MDSTLARIGEYTRGRVDQFLTPQKVIKRTVLYESDSSP